MTKSNNFLDQIPERLKQIRRASGLSQVEISEKIGVNRSFYSNAENGNQLLSFDFLYKLCVELNVSADFVLFNSGNMFRENRDLRVCYFEIDSERYSGY